MFSTPEAPAQGISAIKALAIASAQGQKIWTITQNNLETAMAALQLDADSKAEIRAGVLAGNVVTAHEKPINFNGWVGEGYTIIDPQTGAGAYKIAGGGNGANIKGLLGAKAMFYWGTAEHIVLNNPLVKFLKGVDGIWGFIASSIDMISKIGALMDKCRGSLFSTVKELFAMAILMTAFMTMAALVASSSATFIGGFIVGTIADYFMERLHKFLLNFC